MKKQVIIVVSGGITIKGKLPFFVKNRLDEAYKLFHKDVSSRIILSGKWSYLYDIQPEKTEARAMLEYLESIGTPKKNILLEEKSQDLISSAYYLRKIYLGHRRFQDIVVIASDFQEERITYVFKKVLGSNFKITFHLVPSQLSPSLLWEFFTYERHTLLKTQAFLRRMKKGDYRYLTDRLFKARYYKDKISSNIRQLVIKRKIGKKSYAKAHYSLVSIYKKRKEIFDKYGLEAKSHRFLKADFWSGRFLNFIGKDKDKKYYCLKFGLQPKDKTTFKKEITLTEKIKRQNFSFVPSILDKNFQKAPIWYLYRVVSGKMAGKFSIDFSFNDSFFKDFTKKKFIKNLKKLRSITSDFSELSIFTPTLYKKRFTNKLQNIRSNKKFSKSQTLLKTEMLFNSKLKLLNKVKLFISHNDLHPGNIIVSSKEKKLYFIDFEHVSYNNIAFDFCFGYVFSWSNLKFQKELYDEFTNSLNSDELKEFNMIFPVVYCYFLIWLLDYTEKWKIRIEKERYKEVKRYIFSELKKL